MHPEEPHWYLAFVGVDPALQRTGVGSRLLAPVQALADHDGLPCYLETPFPETHAFYRRLGFEVATLTQPFAGAPGLWTMVRPPAAARQNAHCAASRPAKPASMSAIVSGTP